MKFKEGKKVWGIIMIVVLALMIFGTVGAFIKNHDFDIYNLVIIFLLLFSLSNVIEKKK